MAFTAMDVKALREKTGVRMMGVSYTQLTLPTTSRV